MKTNIKFTKKEIRNMLITLIGGLLIGWLIFGGSGSDKTKTETEAAIHDHEAEKATIWTCSMHPQIRMDKPGKCPICAMDLIPLDEMEAEEAAAPGDIQLSESAIKLADIQTMTVKKAYPEKEVHLLGKVEADERNIAEMTARFGGRIEKLYVNFTGQEVRQGEKLASIYSPDLVTAQQELLEALEYKESNPNFYRAVRNKLKLWDLTDAQINKIEEAGEAQTRFDILSPIAGTVTDRHVAVGDYIKEGDPLFQVTDLSKVWVLFEAYESDLPWIEKGDKIDFTIRSVPGKTFSDRITFIDPTINPQTRVANVRVEMNNSSGQLKPGMFANGIVEASVSGNKKDLLIPKTAVLWTGKRSVVYVKVPNKTEPTFRYREITLGPDAGSFYVVNDGLTEGDEIAVNGVFKIDAAAQLAGKPSMMNPGGGAGSTGHHHGGMNMEPDQGETGMNMKASKPDPKFVAQLSSVYDAYIPMKNAFVQSDAAQVKTEAQAVQKKLQQVDMALLKGENHKVWMEYLDAMKPELDRIAGSDDLEKQREGFAGFNLALYNAIKTFGLENETVYFQYCPMALDEKGAYWFSEMNEIRNPYFGDKMLKCGETREEFD
ncbi:MAG TPA: efflux RND transporter periplasmic adaptor subunit, partial [Bacteroidales bacterium]|nr:efflux RND transporter periplasmic adaptor subunit [Bacteroidales bacterium]